MCSSFFAWPDEGARGRRKKPCGYGIRRKKDRIFKETEKELLQKTVCRHTFCGSKVTGNAFWKPFFDGFPKAEVKKGKRHYEKV